MNTQDILNDKLSIITWVSQLQDVSLIKKLKEIQTGHTDVPQWQKDAVAGRLELIEKGEMKTRSWQEAKKEIFKK